jgi:8-oxo-dGTP pyrophosphatase MutT (NUDIX family)
VRRPEEVFVFVRRGDDFLVLRRAPARGGYWHGVAGALEDGESYAAAARRELLEETGLVAEPTEVSGVYAYPVDEDPGWRTRYPAETREILVRTFLIDVPPEWEPELDHEHDDYRWLPRDEAAELFYWPEPRQVLRSL